MSFNEYGMGHDKFQRNVTLTPTERITNCMFQTGVFKPTVILVLRR
jgi:hypothetical protein